ncbi:MAG: serine/threonine protein phosphatase, partial [Ignavibacteriales bacterium CG12_big_fil_rev_8_21_14_0_65_30_8]
MEQKKLQKTVEIITSKEFNSEKEMLKEVLNQIVDNENVDITGGRIWKLDKNTEEYKLLYQVGNVDEIKKNFKLKVSEYPIFDVISENRTILGDETNEILKAKGILKYSASGVGYKIMLNNKKYYQYIFSINNENLNEQIMFNLSIIATTLTAKLKQLHTSKKADFFRAGIDKAREIQRSILPEHEYHFHDYELFGLTKPAEIVGGDFFDYLEVGDDNDRLGVALGDAASKGVGAAAEAMYISGALRMASNFEIKIAPLMRRMNKQINKIFDDDKFATFFYGELSTDNCGLFLYSSAGHNPPFFLKKNSSEIIKLMPTGPVFGPVPNAKYKVDNINFSEGDILVLYSDGITDSSNK